MAVPHLIAELPVAHDLVARGLVRQVLCSAIRALISRARRHHNVTAAVNRLTIATAQAGRPRARHAAAPVDIRVPEILNRYHVR